MYPLRSIPKVISISWVINYHTKSKIYIQVRRLLPIIKEKLSSIAANVIVNTVIALQIKITLTLEIV